MSEVAAMTDRIARRGWWAWWLAALVACATCDARAGSVVYSNDFENAAGPEWSSNNVETTPAGNRHFLGGFTTDKVTLTLEKLPKHAYVRVTLDLYVMGTWYGNGTVTLAGARIGPNYWRMGVDGGVTLVDASFSNMDFISRSVPRDATLQSYPSVLPGEAYLARTGAAESNTLGVEWEGFEDGVSRQVDTVYPMSFVIRHDGTRVAFDFQGGDGLQAADGESWGLDNVKVEVLDDADVKRPDVAEMRRLWKAVGGHDPVAETAAFWGLAAGGDAAADFLRDRVPRGGVDRKRFDALVAQLDGGDFQARECATEALKAMGPPIEALLHDAADRAESAEVKLRLESILRGMGTTPPADPQMRRHAIAMRLLRVIGTPEAAKVARELSGK